MPGTRCSGGRWAAGRLETAAPLRRSPALLDTSRRRRLLPRAGRPARPDRARRVARRADRVLPARVDPRGRLRLRQAAPGDPPRISTCRWSASTSARPSSDAAASTSTGSIGSSWSWPRARAAVPRPLVRPGPDLGGDPAQPARRRRADPPRGHPGLRAGSPRTTRTPTSATTATATTPPPGIARRASRWPSRGRSRPSPSLAHPSSAWPSRGDADPSRRRPRPPRSSDEGRPARPRQPGRDARRPARAGARHPDRPGAALGARPVAAGGLHRACGSTWTDRTARAWGSAWGPCRRSRSSAPRAARPRPAAWPTSPTRPTP